MNDPAPLPRPERVAALIRAIPTLTPAELRVCTLMLDGCSTREIARTLGVSERTVQHQRQSIRRKLGVRENLAVALMAVVGG